MLAYLQKLRAERDTLSATSSGILDKAAQEDRPVSETERASIDKMAERCATIDDELKTFSAQYESQKRYAELRAVLETADDKPEKKELARRVPADVERRDSRAWGKLFVESAEFRAYDGNGRTPRVRVPGLFERDPITLGEGWGLPAVPFTATVPMPAITTPLLDAIGHVTTNNNVVQWLIDDGGYPVAPVVPEATPKPEADIAVSMETGTLETYAHWKAITRQALANIPMIQSIVENKLRGGIFQALENAVGAVLAASAPAVVPVGAAGLLGAIRTAIAQVQVNGFPNANSVLLNPADWSELDLAVMGATVNGPVRGANFWGLNPIASAAVPEGTAYVGDLRNAVTLFDEGAASVFMTDSHADYFIRNILVVLAEVSALALVTQASALVRVTGGGGSGAGGASAPASSGTTTGTAK